MMDRVAKLRGVTVDDLCIQGALPRPAPATEEEDIDALVEEVYGGVMPLEIRDMLKLEGKLFAEEEEEELDLSAIPF